MLQLVDVSPNTDTEPSTGILQYTVELREKGFLSWLGFGDRMYINVWAYSSAEAKVRAEKYAPFGYISDNVYLFALHNRTITKG